MSTTSVSSPYPIFNNSDGLPLSDGYIYIGEVNLNPEAYPKKAYWDEALKITAAQPIRTINGYPSRNGSPARIYVDENYSIVVKNKIQSVVYSSLSTTDLFSLSNYSFETGKVVGSVTYFIGLTSLTNGNAIFVTDANHGGEFVYDTSILKTAHDGGTIFDPDIDMTTWTYTSANAGFGVLRRLYDGAINVKWFGAIGDNGITDNYPAYNAVKLLNTEVDIPDSQNNYFLSNIVDGVLSAFSPGPTALWKNFTSNGKLKWFTGFFSDGEFGSNIWRFRDRLFVGDAADYSGNRLGANGYGTSWVTAKVGSYLVKNATMAVAANELDEINGARYGLVSFSKSMGVGAIALNDGVGTTARGLYSEVVHNPTTGGTSTSIEAQCGNFTGILPVANAYSMSGSQVNGIQIASEAGTGYTVGDADTPITPATQPSGTAIDITGGSTVSPEHSWVTGMVFRDGALNRDGVTSNAIAISLARKHELIWGVGISAPRVSYIRSEVSSINTSSGVILQDRGVKFEGYGDKHIFEVYDAVAASGVAANYLRVTNSLAGSPVTLEALGTDVDIDVRLKTKGNGVPRFGNVASVSAETVTGYITIKDSSGVLRKLAVLS